MASCFTVHTCIVIIYNHKARQDHSGCSAVDSLFQGCLFLVSAGLYLSRREEYLGFLVLCLALSWVNLLYFSRGDIHMGIYSVMIQKVVHTRSHYTTVNIAVYNRSPEAFCLLCSL